MPASIWRIWLRWAILAPFLIGCQGFSNTPGPPHDPLFLSKVPTTAKAEFAPPIAFAYLEPTLPKDPFLSPNAPALADKNQGRVPATLTNRIKDQE